MLGGLLFQFFLSAAVIVIAGTFLAKAADLIAELTKLGRLLVGSVFLAGATSLPELSVDISAIRGGMPDLAVGDLMGSSLANLLILAVADLMHKSSRKIFSRASAAHALSGAISISLAAIAAIMIFLSPRVTGFEVGAVGVGPLFIAVFYVLGLRLLYFDQKTFASEMEQPRSSAPDRRRELSKAVMVFGLSAIAILVAGPFLAESAGGIADLTGLGKTFIGSTLVALSTSLPEVVSTVAAVRMGAFDLAVGNIFGSNSFNMFLLLPLDLVHDGPLLASVSPSHIVTSLATILATSVAIMGQLYQVEKRKRLIEPDAFAIIGVVLTALLALYHLAA
ncbi:MAG: sodium:calcium antiporter [Bdellovibrionales bacterium]|nr:sodium:calcium antiporter [Bdellovibrionales bacterium]